MTRLHLVGLVAFAILAAAIADRREPRPSPGVVAWEERGNGEVIVQVTRDGGRFAVTIRPEYIYQQVAYSVARFDGKAQVRVQQWEVSAAPLKSPAARWGLRDLDSLRWYLRVRYEYLGRDGRRLTIYEGSRGWLVRVVTVFDGEVPGE